MSKYSIKELENLTGIKAHTIRIWEKRYNLLEPNRTNTNIRFYGDNELRKLLNVTSLLSNGYKISKIAEMSDKDISDILDKHISDLKQNDNISETLTNQLIVAAINYDELAFEKAFSSSILRYGLYDSYLKVIYPLLEKIGIMWAKTDLTPAQEHFISNLIKQKIQTAIDNIPPVTNPKSNWILFLPEEEHHEIGLLFSSYIIKKNGNNVIYLGSRVPMDSVFPVLEKFSDSNILFFLVKEFNSNDIVKLIEKIKLNFPFISINISSNNEFLARIDSNIDFNKINSVEGLLKKV